MCGITGWVSYQAGINTGDLQAMTATMACRGPDDEGLWSSAVAGLGHRRLSVIDLTGGHQPMTYNTAGGPVVLTFCGEVYNYRELRRELQSYGHKFHTKSDTEVILVGYVQWGARVAQKLRGMFAFAIWDSRSGKLVLVRDRLGVKPLCYYPTADGVIFGSEPKAILAHPWVTPAVGMDGWRERFAFIKTPGELAWEGMHEVKPGSVVTVDERGVRQRAYWTLQSRRTNPSAAMVRELLEQIVSEQLVADVPVGTLLSGGVDSSLITALAARELTGQPISTYVVDFAGHSNHLAGADVLQRSPDAPFAQQVAAMWGTNHSRIVLDPIQLASPELRGRAVRARDLPLGLGDHDASHLLLFEKIRETSTVALSGELADEQFAGYPIFFSTKVIRGHSWPWHLLDARSIEDELSSLNPEFRAALGLTAYTADRYSETVRQVGRVEGESAFDHRLREITFIEITRHGGYLLDFTDRLSMAVGLEIRAPYTDHRLVELIYNARRAIRAPRRQVKGLLKAAATGLLPQPVLERQKSAYPWTPDPGYLLEIQRQAKELVAQPHHPVFAIVSRPWLQQIANKPVSRIRRGERYGINLALETALWIEIRRPVLLFN